MRINNAPLTLEELQQMDGHPVWVHPLSDGWGRSRWGLVSTFYQKETGKIYVYIYDTRSGARTFSSQEYGTCWIAFRHYADGDLRWISAADRLPEKDGSYIVCSGKSGAVFTAHFWAQSKAWSGRSNGKYITHWMPLPEPPVYEKEDSYNENQ